MPLRLILKYNISIDEPRGENEDGACGCNAGVLDRPDDSAGSTNVPSPLEVGETSVDLATLVEFETVRVRREIGLRPGPLLWPLPLHDSWAARESRASG